MKKMNEFFTCAIMLDSLTLTHAQFVIMLIALQKVLSQELKRSCSKITTVLSEWTIPWMWISYIFIALQI